MFELRPYQSESVSRTWEYLRNNPEKNGCLVLPTGAGKTPVIAALCREAIDRWDGRVIVLTHVAELVDQLSRTLTGMLSPGDVGIYSAGLGSRDLDHPVLVGQIQSVYRAGGTAFGRRDLILIDEAHLVPKSGDGMYRGFLAELQGANPHARLIGLTATPYRLDSGPIVGPDELFDDVIFEANVRDLIEAGYLSKLVSRVGSKSCQVDLRGVSVSGGDYNLEELGRRMSSGHLVPDTVADILDRCQGRKSILVFCPTIAHGELVLAEFRSKGVPAGFVTGKTPGLERGWLVDEFRRGVLRVLVNVGCLTTGFDATGVDAVCLLRGTMSISLYVQMVGRGFRLHPGKENCLVLDYADLLLTHGPIDQVAARPRRKGNGEKEAPTKTCPECGERAHLAARECPGCGHPFPPPDPAGAQFHRDTPAELPVLSDTKPTVDQIQVDRVTYSKHFPKDRGDGRPMIPSLRVGYWQPSGMIPERWPTVSEWVCLEHPKGSFARQKAEAWWEARSLDPVPDTIDQAVRMAEGGSLAVAFEVTVKRKTPDSFPEITSWKLGPKPGLEHDPEETVPPGDGVDELPF
jgi:DNA repair protein RadD